MRSLVSRTSNYLLVGAILIMATSLFAGSGLYSFTLNSIDGKSAPLADYKGKVVLIVNVASQCGYTPQYSALEAIYEKYKDRGFVIVGFPANNFGAQEPGTNEEIKTFCSRKYNVTFDRRRDPMELHEVPRRSQRECGAALRTRRHPGFDGSDQRDREAAEAIAGKGIADPPFAPAVLKCRSKARIRTDAAAAGPHPLPSSACIRCRCAITPP